MPLMRNRLSSRNLKQDTPINSNNLTIDILVLRQKDNPLRHLLITSSSLRRHMTLLFRRHFTRKIPRCDTIDSDTRFLELVGHEFGEVNGSSFRGVVGKVTLCVTHYARHGGDDDHGG